MYKVNNILSLSVLSLYEGDLIGQITKIYFDKKLKKVQFFVISSEGDLSYILYPKQIYRLGKNAITIKNSHCLVLNLDNFSNDVIPAPIDSKAYTIQGEYIGKITQISLNEKFYVENIVLDNEKIIDNSKLASCGKGTIIVYDENTKINVSRFKFKINPPKIFKSKQTTLVSTLPITPTTETTSDKNVQSSNNPKFMIGRIVTKDILIDEKKILIRANSTITEKTLATASNNNKLKELMIYSRQK